MGVAAFVFATVSIFVGVFIGGVFSSFVSSWLSFVMSIYIPMFLHKVWKVSQALEFFWQNDCSNMQRSIEANLDAAFRDVEQSAARAVEVGRPEDFTPVGAIKSRTGKLTARFGRTNFVRKIVAGIRRQSLPSLLRSRRHEKDASNASSPAMLSPCTSRQYDEDEPLGQASLRNGAQAEVLEDPASSWDMDDLPVDSLLQPMQPSHEVHCAAMRGRKVLKGERPRAEKSRARTRSPARTAQSDQKWCSPRDRGRSPQAKDDPLKASI